MLEDNIKIMQPNDSNHEFMMLFQHLLDLQDDFASGILGCSLYLGNSSLSTCS